MHSTFYERVAAKCGDTVLSRSITPKMAALQNVCVMAIPMYIAITFYPLVIPLGPVLPVVILAVSWLAALTVQLVICELISWDPNAAGQFHWIYRLRRWKGISFMVGNILCFTWTCGTVAVSYFNASNLVGVIAVHQPDMATATWLPWLLTSIFIILAVLGSWIIISGARYMWPVLLGAWVLFVAWFLAMFLSADLQNPFGERLYAYKEPGGIPRADAIIGAFIGALVSFSIQDTGSHLGEEYESAKTKLPAGIIVGHCINGILALATMLALMAATPTLDVILEAPFGQYHLALCLGMSGRDISPIGKADSVGITTSIMLLTAGSFGLATASRCIFAGARIGLFPQSANRILALLYHSKPWPAMIVAMLVSLAIALFTLSADAFRIVSSLSTLGLWLSFITTLIAVITHKLSDRMLPDGGALFPTFGLPTSLSLQLRLGVSIFALMCAIPLFFILCFPLSLDPATIDAGSFPWAPIVFLIIFILAAVLYRLGWHNYHPEDAKPSDVDLTDEESAGHSMQKQPGVAQSGLD